MMCGRAGTRGSERSEALGTQIEAELSKRGYELTTRGKSLRSPWSQEPHNLIDLFCRRASCRTRSRTRWYILVA